MKVSVINKKKMTKSQEEVLERFIEFQEAMIEKDQDMLNEILNDNYTLTHMSGKTQTKQEYIDEIKDIIVYKYMPILNNFLSSFTKIHTSTNATQ